MRRKIFKLLLALAMFFNVFQLVGSCIILAYIETLPAAVLYAVVGYIPFSVILFIIEWKSFQRWK